MSRTPTRIQDIINPQSKNISNIFWSISETANKTRESTANYFLSTRGHWHQARGRVRTFGEQA